MIGVERREMKFDGKHEVDEADKEAVGVERRLEDDEGGLIIFNSCKKRCGGDENKEQLRKSGLFLCAVKTCFQVE